MPAFDTAWDLLKMPYYHGTSSAFLPSIREKGLMPVSHEESHWSSEKDVDYGGPDPDGPQEWAFVTDSPDSALAYAGKYGTPDAPEGANQQAFQAPHHPIVLQILDEVEELEGFGRGPYGDYRLPTSIPPELISIIYRGPEYLRWNDDADDLAETRRHWDRYHEQMDTPWMSEESL